MKFKKKPTRRELLKVVEELQGVLEELKMSFHDRNPNRAEEITTLIEKGWNLCYHVRSFDPPSELPNN